MILFKDEQYINVLHVEACGSERCARRGGVLRKEREQGGARRGAAAQRAGTAAAQRAGTAAAQRAGVGGGAVLDGCCGQKDSHVPSQGRAGGHRAAATLIARQFREAQRGRRGELDSAPVEGIEGFQVSVGIDEIRYVCVMKIESPQGQGSAGRGEGKRKLG
ncbi:hypothetical protein C8R44DRAFT_751887 [Mycena epipterygia]|nr:hypothetical protein C8R44DRAFT_751887 [Mycena epipterygia]